MSDLIPAESMPGDVAEDVPVHYMPEPILELIISGKLGCVLVLARWHVLLSKSLPGHSARKPPYEGPLPGWPPMAAPIWSHIDQCQKHTQSYEKFDASALEDIIVAVHKLAPSLHHRDEEGLKAAEHIIHIAESWKASISGEMDCERVGGILHSSVHLVHGLRAISKLKGGAKSLADVVVNVNQKFSKKRF